MLLRLILLAALISSCALVTPDRVAVMLPARPTLAVCPEKPAVGGEVRDGKVVMELPDAVKLRDWINAYQICAESNEAALNGHVEKLENRLKALGDGQ